MLVGGYASCSSLTFNLQDLISNSPYSVTKSDV